MNVKDAIESRRSIRSYERRPIPKDVMDHVLEAARLSPSSENLQNWKIIVVSDDDTRRRLVPVSANQVFVHECSAYLVGVTDGGETGATDVAIALDHVSLRAVELGLGTCWIGDFNPEKTKELLHIPKDRHITICMTLGYPAEHPEATRRKKPSELFLRDSWDAGWP